MADGISKLLRKKKEMSLETWIFLRSTRYLRNALAWNSFTKEKELNSHFTSELRILWPFVRWFFLMRIYFCPALFPSLMPWDKIKTMRTLRYLLVLSHLFYLAISLFVREKQIVRDSWKIRGAEVLHISWQIIAVCPLRMLNENLENNLRRAQYIHCVKHEWWACKKMSEATLSRVLLHEGASDFLPGDEFDVTTRMQKRVTEIDGRQSERVVFLVRGRPTDINSQQLSSHRQPWHSLLSGGSRNSLWSAVN